MNHPLFAITISSITSALFAYIAFRLYFRQQITTNHTGILILENKLLFAVLYGIFTMYAGFIVTPHGATVRLLGPMFVGIMAGCRYGVLTSLFGVTLLCVKEWLHYIPNTELVGNTFYSSILATLLAGYLPGLWHRKLRGRLPSIWQAVAFSIAFELLIHLPITLLVGWPFEVLWQAAQKTLPELIVATAIGMAIMVFVIRNLLEEKLALSERQRISSELLSAKVVHQGLTEKKYPPPFTIPHIDLCASTPQDDSANHTFFEYYYCKQEHKLYVIMVEMTELTTTATLCLLIIKTLFKNKAKRGATIQSILTDIRHELSVVSAATQKRTSFLGVIDLHTGFITDYITTNSCAWVRRNANDWYELTANNAPYQLKTGDSLVIATNAKDKIDLATIAPTIDSFFTSTTPMQQSASLLVDFFMQHANATHSDKDGALMVITYQDHTENLELRVDLQELKQLQTWIAQFAETHQLTPKNLFTLQLIMEELFVNIIHYGFPDQAIENERIAIQLRLANEQLSITLTDRGQAFNPLTYTPTTPRKKQTIGGLGIPLVQKFVSNSEYKRQDDCNILTLELNVNRR